MQIDNQAQLSYRLDDQAIEHIEKRKEKRLDNQVELAYRLDNQTQLAQT